MMAVLIIMILVLILTVGLTLYFSYTKKELEKEEYIKRKHAKKHSIEYEIKRMRRALK